MGHLCVAAGVSMCFALRVTVMPAYRAPGTSTAACSTSSAITVSESVSGRLCSPCTSSAMRRWVASTPPGLFTVTVRSSFMAKFQDYAAQRRDHG